MIVDVVQFISPDGRQNNLRVEVPDDCATNYKSLEQHYCRLTAEVLLSGMVSLAVEHAAGDFLIEICNNDHTSPANKLVKMLREFDEAEFLKWISIKS